MKRTITNSKELQQAMDDLQRRVKEQEGELKANYEQVKENLRMKNVLKNKFHQLAETPEIQRTLMNTALGMVIGFTAKKVSEVLSEQSLNRTVENILNNSINQLEQRDPGSMISKGITLIRKYTPKDSPIYPFVRYKEPYVLKDKSL
jgi:predicted nuclease with TOPRIM domain